MLSTAQPLTRDWWPRSDSNRDCSVPKTDASCQLGYRAMLAEGERVELSSPFGSSVFGTDAVAIFRLDLPCWCRVRDSNPLAQRERLMSHPISHAASIWRRVKELNLRAPLGAASV